ncbi:MAG: hypothetical protein ACXVXC_00495 [Nocardioidaceae bacterium]
MGRWMFMVLLFAAVVLTGCSWLLSSNVAARHHQPQTTHSHGVGAADRQPPHHSA